MEIDDNQLFSIEETAKIMSVGTSTLRSWDNSGYFVASRTKGQHRRYSGKQIKEMQEKMLNY